MHTPWTREAAIIVIQQWAERNGRQPTCDEWQALRKKPSRPTLTALFGSWAKTMEAAGFTARTRGQYDRVRLPRPSCVSCGAPVRHRHNRFCSLLCAGHHHTRTSGVFVRGVEGRLTFQTRDGQSMFLSRAIAAGAIGRLLREDEFVIHINNDPTDDRVENLAIVRKAHVSAAERAAATPLG